MTLRGARRACLCDAEPAVGASLLALLVNAQTCRVPQIQTERFPLTLKELFMNTLIDVAIADGHFKTLAKALTAAGLVDTLKGSGPFTVFAPTDEAFAKIPKADLDALLKDKAKLKAVLTYHVVPGKVMSKDLKAGKVTTVQGSEVTISTVGGAMVNNAKVVSADVAADNGVIHVIDTVLMPK